MQEVSLRLDVTTGTSKLLHATLSIQSLPSAVVLISKVPLFISLPELLGAIGDDALGHVKAVSAVAVVANSAVYAVVVRCVSEAAAVHFIGALPSSPPSALCSEPLSASFVLDDANVAAVLPAVQAPPTAPRGNSPLFSAADSNACSICLELFGAGAAATATLVCGHTFHLACCAQVAQETCPICRFDMSQMGADSTCLECGVASDLWLCLICGAVSCGRQQPGRHAQAHYQATRHSLAAQVGGCRVWDYDADEFIHRLALADDNSVPVPTKAPARWCDEGDDEEERVLFQSKVDVVVEYYTRLLNSQLHRQQEYFERLCDFQSAAHIFEQENSGRFSIVSECVSERKKVLSQLRKESARLAEELERGTKKLLETSDFLTTTIASVEVGNEKLRARIAGAPSLKKGEQESLISSLESELSALLQQFCSS